MISIESLMSISKEEIPDAARTMKAEDIKLLVELLSEKDDKIRYNALQLLQSRSPFSPDVYPYWDIFVEKLSNDNSYQRSIGVMLISENVRWDSENRTDKAIDKYLDILNYDKPITVRQCIQALTKIVAYKKHLHKKISESLMSINISAVKETMRKTTLVDILTILAQIRKEGTTDEIESHIFSALSGGVLDKKAIKQIEILL